MNGCSRLCRQSNIDGRSQTEADGGLRGDVLLADLVAIQSQRLQPGEVGHVGEGAKATQSELWRGGGEGVNLKPQTSSIRIKRISVVFVNVDDWVSARFMKCSTYQWVKRWSRILL